jgi:hypothetical protein
MAHAQEPAKAKRSVGVALPAIHVGEYNAAHCYLVSHQMVAATLGTMKHVGQPIIREAGCLLG